MIGDSREDMAAVPMTTIRPGARFLPTARLREFTMHRLNQRVQAFE